MIIFISMVIGICAVVGVNVKKENESKVIQSSETTTEQSVKEEKSFVELVNEISITEMIIEIEKVVQQWEKKKITTNEAIILLQEYKKVNYEDIILLIDEKISYINLEATSEKIYLEAEEYFHQGKYIEVFEVLKEISSEYTKYVLIEELEGLCKEMVLQKVSNPYTVEEYEKCIFYLEKCIINVNDIDFVNRKDVLERELIIVKDISDIIDTAVNLYDKEMYQEAFVILGVGLEQYPQNERIETKLVDFHNHFIIYNTKRVAELCEEEKYKQALNILDEALVEYECEELLSLKEKVKEEKIFYINLKMILLQK